MTGLFDRDVTLWKVKALSNLLQEVWVAEDDVKLVFHEVELKSDLFKHAGKVIRDWSVGIRVAVVCNVEIFHGLERDSPGVSIETVLVESLKPGNSIIFHKCTKNYDYMLYCSWDVARDDCNCYFSFWTSFCLFTLITARKMKTSENKIKFLEMSSFYTSVPEIMIIWYTVPEI